MRLIGSMTLALLVLTSAVFAAQRQEQRPLVDSPELVLTRSGGMETVAMPASAYSELEVDGSRASFVLEGHALSAGSKTLRGGGISKVSWVPRDAADEPSTMVELEFTSEPRSSLLNAVEGTPGRPRTPQVLAGFIFDKPAQRSAEPGVLGARNPQGTAAPAQSSSAHGNYKLPPFEEVRYSDALVTLKVVNADFRDVLNLLCQIGGVSYVIDPYYEDEPTGNIRSGKSGGSGGLGGGELGGGSPGFPQDGTGSITLNFNQVPFDQALELLLETAGLVKTDIYPRG